MEAQYPIRTASRLTSLSLDTLRAWERRYGVVTPERTDRGRLYSKSNIAKLTLLRKLVEQGYSIGEIAALDGSELQALLVTDRPPDDRPQMLAPQVQQLADYFGAYDDLGAGYHLNRFAILLTPRDLVVTILVPLVREARERISNGQMSLAQGHMIFAAVHNVLASLLRVHSSPRGAPRMLLSTLPGDLHDLGILAAATIAANTGWAPVFLGPNLPVAEISDAARRTRSEVIVIGNSGICASAGSLYDLAELLPAEVSIWVGGTAPDQPDAATAASVVSVADMAEFEILCREAVR